MTGLETAAVDLQIAGRNFETLAADGRDDLARIAARVEELVSARWRSSASSSFARGFEDWRSAAADALTRLELLGQAVGQAGRDYSVDDTNSAADLHRSAGAGL